MVDCEDEESVYVKKYSTGSAEVYHTNEDCQYLKSAIAYRTITLRQAKDERELPLCKVCNGEVDYARPNTGKSILERLLDEGKVPTNLR